MGRRLGPPLADGLINFSITPPRSLRLFSFGPVFARLFALPLRRNLPISMLPSPPFNLRSPLLAAAPASPHRCEKIESVLGTESGRLLLRDGIFRRLLALAGLV